MVLRGAMNDLNELLLVEEKIKEIKALMRRNGVQIDEEELILSILKSHGKGS